MNKKYDKETEKAISQVDAFESQVKDLTMDRMNEAPKLEVEPQTKLSQNEIAKSKDVYLKPKRSIGSKEKFNEDYRDEYNFGKEYVQFIAEHKEIIGENIEIWTKAFAGIPAEYWEVPTNKPVWGPRYLAEQIKRCNYHRLKTTDQITSGMGHGSIYSQLIVDSTISRLDAIPVNSKRSVFMGAKNF